MQQSLFSEKVDVYRRIADSRDVLNNPSYGNPVTGIGWNLVYLAMPARLAFSDKIIEFAHGGERIIPHGTLYFAIDFQIKQEDRIVTDENIMYIVTSIRKAYRTSSVLDHLEAILALP